MHCEEPACVIHKTFMPQALSLEFPNCFILFLKKETIVTVIVEQIKKNILGKEKKNPLLFLGVDAQAKKTGSIFLFL